MKEGAMGVLYGLRVVPSPGLPRFQMVQYKFPKTKRKRILKKWSKRSENFRQIPVKSAYITNNDTLFIHPDELREIQHKLRRRN